MLIATALVAGFQNEISSKVFGFWGHIHITKYGFGRSFEDNPIEKNQPFYPAMEVDNVRHIQVFANKPGIIKTEDQIEGIILKGVGDDFDWNFFDQYLVEGRVFDSGDSVAPREVLISTQTANRLRLKIGDDLNVYFIQTPPRIRSLIVCGIYNSGLEEYDKYYALVDIRHVQRLNDWDDKQIGGFEVYIHDVDKLNATADYIYYDVLGPNMLAQTIKEIYPNIFDWLSLQNMNEVIILVLMVLVATINMITCLLILILERTNMIGILKALGAGNWAIRKIFIYKAAYILGLGVLIGNVLGLGLCLAQKHFHLIHLPQESYYVSVVPVDLNFYTIMLLNIGTFIICISALLLPSYLASKITPIKAIRLD